MEDNYRHKGMRKKLVDEIRKKGILDEQILEAINAVPRHLFMDSSFLQFAYEDKPFPIGSGQTISQPYTVAFQTQLLDVKPGAKILEIGTGSGYQACVLAEMGAEVYSIERQKKLYEKTKKFLSKFQYKLHLFCGDGYLGLPKHAPFDGILITAAAPEIPQTLVDQMKVGGVLVIPLGGTSTQTMYRMVKMEDGSLAKEAFGEFRFVPLLKDISND
ncbi:MAG: protein-L-isoaspartate(D-aspartate) O-methyltransferase [Bacteroidales bacterium]|nr:protein-L-isoaspartate(D-aspartate) O-methyltransferase [Bacteroidales bacterium]